jgi:hypothetical protein
MADVKKAGGKAAPAANPQISLNVNTAAEYESPLVLRRKATKHKKESNHIEALQNYLKAALKTEIEDRQDLYLSLASKSEAEANKGLADGEDKLSLVADVKASILQARTEKAARLRTGDAKIDEL